MQLPQATAKHSCQWTGGANLVHIVYTFTRKVEFPAG